MKDPHSIIDVQSIFVSDTGSNVILDINNQMYRFNGEMAERLFNYMMHEYQINGGHESMDWGPKAEFDYKHR
jgi:hypothetical protein|tara:strand:- start:1132 stop:1347 length:216 start_codon:yes stop_codon:yes gene_type:complete